jgi:RNA polymerase primary sigma factor
MDLGEIIRTAIKLGRQHGYVTFDQLNELLPSDSDVKAPEDIEEIMTVLSEAGINVVEGD